jgi:hypothetical protein
LKVVVVGTVVVAPVTRQVEFAFHVAVGMAPLFCACWYVEVLCIKSLLAVAQVTVPLFTIEPVTVVTTDVPSVL